MGSSIQCVLANRSFKVRLCVVAIFLSLASFSMANAAMGLALEMFEFKTWLVYVVVMVGLEAWLLGINRGVSWQRSLVTSVSANFVTALF